ncbi:hypothetical protein FMUND_3884 [Fusarium mundagurra]|uniref:Uncharacterized protein n=1 Tax=Fusarium mundagurra TaxID=1567541 RepID=A0A8H5Z0M1_9HYPO|nr:hypothetical protein FMUND_3884 [Fusarium mundagurra]
MSTANPTSPTDIGQALINALNNPTGSLTRSMLSIEDDGSFSDQKRPRFILQSYGYLDLRVSLVAGMTFPADTSSFETLYPKASLPSLNSFDPLLYQETETTIVDFWNSCNEFSSYALTSFWTVFAETQILCQALIDQLGGVGETSLQGMISTLTSQTYSQPGSENDLQFKDLAQNASGMLVNLSQLANQKATSIQGLAAGIAAQASKIQAMKQEIDSVVKKFGLVDGDKYIATLDSTFAMNQIVLNNSVEETQVTIANWERELTQANGAVSYIWIPVTGWLSASNPILSKQNNFRMAWAKYQAHIAKKSTDTNKTAYALAGAVNLLFMQNGVLCDRLRTVGVALQEIQSTFAAIGSNLGQAATLMAAADGSVRTSLIANQQAIQAGITKAVKEFQDTLSAVQSLVAIDSKIQTTGITADIDAPSIYPE